MQVPTQVCTYFIWHSSVALTPHTNSNGGGKYGENLVGPLKIKPCPALGDQVFQAAGTGSSYGYENGLKSWMDEACGFIYTRRFIHITDGFHL